MPEDPTSQWSNMGGGGAVNKKASNSSDIVTDLLPHGLLVDLIKVIQICMLYQYSVFGR